MLSSGAGCGFGEMLCVGDVMLFSGAVCGFGEINMFMKYQLECDFGEHERYDE